MQEGLWHDLWAPTPDRTPHFVRIPNTETRGCTGQRGETPGFVTRGFKQTMGSPSPALLTPQGPGLSTGPECGCSLPPGGLTWNSASCLCRASSSTRALSRVLLSSLSSNSLTGRKGTRRPSFSVLYHRKPPLLFELNSTSHCGQQLMPHYGQFIPQILSNSVLSFSDNRKDISVHWGKMRRPRKE